MENNGDYIQRQDYEIATARMHRTITGMLIFAFVEFVALIASNLAWIVHFFG